MPAHHVYEIASDEEAAQDRNYISKKDLQFLRTIDMVECKKCHLRGHVAGDPDRCTQRQPIGLGSWGWL